MHAKVRGLWTKPISSLKGEICCMCQEIWKQAIEIMNEVVLPQMCIQILSVYISPTLANLENNSQSAIPVPLLIFRKFYFSLILVSETDCEQTQRYSR
jgi:hypothetical protein